MMPVVIGLLKNPLVLALIKMFVAIGVVMSAVPMLVWMERKISARFQRRIGPNRVGPMGLLQSIADAIKLMWKEDFFPRNTDRVIFLAAPIMAFLPGVISYGRLYGRPMGRPDGGSNEASKNFRFQHSIGDRFHHRIKGLCQSGAIHKRTGFFKRGQRGQSHGHIAIAQQITGGEIEQHHILATVENRF